MTKYYLNSITNQPWCGIIQYEDDTKLQIRSRPITNENDKEITEVEYKSILQKNNDNQQIQNQNQKDKNQKQLEESTQYAQSDYSILVKLGLSLPLSLKLTGFYSSDFTKKDIKGI